MIGGNTKLLLEDDISFVSLYYVTEFLFNFVDNKSVVLNELLRLGIAFRKYARSLYWL